MIDLKKRWKKTTLNETEFERLQEAYSEPHRRYHTLTHIQDCFEVLDTVFKTAPIEVELAIWFHDVVYDTEEKDSEAKSAEWAGAVLKGTSHDASKVQALILASQHTAEPENRDAAVFLDVDLSILGADKGRFTKYEQDVRQEYAWVPTPLFWRERHRLLEIFRHREYVFWTPEMRASVYESRARWNLVVSDKERHYG